jgi:hypothetical protein
VCAVEGTRACAAQRTCTVQPATYGTGSISLAHAANIAVADLAHAAAERSAQAAAKTARGTAAEHLCLKQRSAADERKRRDWLDEVLEVHD